MHQIVKLLSLILIFLLLNGCSSNRYKDLHDSTPTRIPNQAELKDAIARAEPYSRGGNKSTYTVRGKTYNVLSSAQAFEQTGIASWYGNKFHGHLTSNGEIYDMYSMSAAHKNLPLPTYLKVTNTDNNKSVIVRVNDRGPFHHARIIDLSYSAAYKLDMLKTGTANVKITAITHFDKKTGLVPIPSIVNTTKTTAAELTASKPNALIIGSLHKNKVIIINDKESSKSDSMGIATPYIQVFVTSKKELAINTAEELKKQYKQQTSFPESKGLYRIQIGPLNDIATLNALLSTLKKNGYPNAYPKSNPL